MKYLELSIYIVPVMEVQMTNNVEPFWKTRELRKG